MEFVVLAMAFAALLASVAKAAFICGKDQYMDRITKTCTYCSEICHLADRKRTTEECTSKCPYYVTVNIGEGKTVTSPTVTANHEAILTTTQDNSDGISVVLVPIVVAGVVVTLTIATIVGTLIYLGKCCCQSEACPKEVKNRVQKCYKDKDKMNDDQARHGDVEEGQPLQNITGEENKDAVENKETYQPQADGSNNLMLPSGASNAVGDLRSIKV